MTQNKRKNDDPTANRGAIQTLFDRLTLSWRLMADRRVNIFHKLIPPLALLYILSPVDIAPEILLGPFGLVDDIGVAIFALEFFIRMAPNDVVREHLRDLRDRIMDQRGEGDVIDGDYRVRD